MANWKQRVDLSDLWESFDSDDYESSEFIKLRDEVVRRLRALPIGGSDGAELAEVISEFEWADDPEEFDSALDSLYDFGDRGHRLWVGTF